MSGKENGKLTYSFADIDSDERLREMILYIADKCSDDPAFGATKLNKILYFSDFISYLKRGQPITGAEYMRLGQGPVPRRLIPIREEMVAAQDIVIQKREYFFNIQHRVIPLREPDLDYFTPQDIAFVDRVIDMLHQHNAGEVSLLSHGKEWKAAKDQESIPYQAAYLSEAPYDSSDIEFAQEYLAEHGAGIPN